jgi:tetratricopeptide (TPR) repeat protein
MDPAVSGLLDEGRRRYEAGEYADAEPLAARALDLLPPGSIPLDRAVAVQLAGECAYSLGRYHEARTLAEEAAALRAGAPNPDLAETWNLLGVIDIALGDHEAGHARLADALRLREAALGPDAEDTLESLNNLGVALDRLGRAEEAVAAHEEALRRCERAYQSPTRQLAVTCNALAVKLDRDATTRPRATELYERALDAAEAVLGPEHPMVATLTMNIAIGRINRGDVDGASPLVERSLELHERLYGATHPNTATALVTASVVARRDGRVDLARDRAARATAVRLDAFGYLDERTRAAITQLAMSVGAQVKGDPGYGPDAAAVMEAYRDTAPGEIPGDTVRFTPDPARGERSLRAFLAREAERRVGPDPAVKAALDRSRAAGLAADAALLRGDPDVAVVASREAVAAVEAVRGPRHLDLLAPLTRLAGVQRAAEQGRAALATDARVIEVVTAAYGDRHPYALGSRGRLAIDAAKVGDQEAVDEQLRALRAVVADADPKGDAARLVATLERVLARVASHRAAEAADGWRLPPGLH